MSMDNVQLKQEEFLGDDVVLSDINPKTNTNSIEDPATGEQLNLTLQQIWNAINNRLNRIVNSVNGRTGVVVLTSDDVGLGNVDNISFTDMKQWIIDLIEQKFQDKKLNLYTDFSQVLSVVESNDRSFAWAPFFCDIFDSDEKRSVIGFYKWDESTGLLGYEYVLVNTIGYTDRSILYNRSVNGKDMRGGGLAVNIHRDEEALQLVEGQGWEDSGLMIDSTKVRGTVYAFPCLYGKYNASDPQNPRRETALLIIAAGGSDLVKVAIYINDTAIPGGFWLMSEAGGATSFHKIQTGDVILTQFDWYGPDENVIQQYTNTAVMGRQPGYGIVTSAPNRFNPDAPYEIRFYTRKVRATYGLQYITNHQTSIDKLQDTELAVSLLTYDFGTGIGPLNISALNAPQPFDKAYPLDPTADTSSRRPACTLGIELPWTDTESEWPTNFGAGLAITTDYSICTLPFHVTKPAGEPYIDYDLHRYDHEDDDPDGPLDYSKIVGKIVYRGSRKFNNYSTPTVSFDVTEETIEEENKDRKSIENLRLGSKALLSVKTQKMLQVATPLPETGATTNNINVKYNAYDISGLRIGTYYDEIGDVYQQPDPSLVDPLHNTLGFEYGLKKSLGLYDGNDALGNHVDMPDFASLSGGLQINVGKFLEICPKETTDAAHFNDGGKVQVRIGRGLTEFVRYFLIGATHTHQAYDPSASMDEFCYTINDGETYEPIPWTYELLTSEPDRWDDTYRCYYTSQPDPDHPGENVYVKLEERTIPPTWQADTYYLYRPMSTEEVVQHFIDLDPECDPKVYHKIPSNRITLDVDEETLGFNEKGQLTVVGGGGKGSNVRFTDLRSFYFDTVPTEDPTKPVPVDEVVVVGRGLCIRGGKVPSDIFTNVKRLRTYLSDMLDMYIVAYVAEYWMLCVDDFTGKSLVELTQTGQGYNGFRDTVRASTTLADLQSYYDRFERVMIAADTYIKSATDSYLYLMGSTSDLETRINDLMDSINGMSSENKNALLALLRSHYSLDVSINTPERMAEALLTIVHVVDKVDGSEPGWTYPLTWLFNEFVKYVLDPSTIPPEYFEATPTTEPTEEETSNENASSEEET